VLVAGITQWTRDDDRHFHWVDCYFQGAVNLILKGWLSTADRKEFFMLAWPDADFCGDAFATRGTSGFFVQIQSRSPSDSAAAPVYPVESHQPPKVTEDNTASLSKSSSLT